MIESLNDGLHLSTVTYVYAKIELQLTWRLYYLASLSVGDSNVHSGVRGIFSVAVVGN